MFIVIEPMDEEIETGTVKQIMVQNAFIRMLIIFVHLLYLP
jgi:hypothetical protein